MAREPSGIRLFVAAYPPAEVAALLLERLAQFELPPHRPTPREHVHLTLQFIGDVPGAEMGSVLESVSRAAAGLRRFELAPQRIMTLPARGPARLVAVETTAPPALLELQHRLAARLAREPRSRPGDGYTPHLTLCRFRAPSSRLRLDESIAAAAFVVERVRVMRSLLRADGAVHDEVAAVELGRE
jgi:2'-5' RNA ligase